MKRAMLGAGLFVALAAPAQAATLVNAGGVLTFTGDATGEQSLQFSTDQGRVTVTRSLYDQPNTVDVSGCAVTGDRRYGDYRCDGVTAVVINAGPGADWIVTSRLDVPAAVNGGAGDDLLHPGSGDTVSGGSGFDLAEFTARATAGAFSLNGVADDGWIGEPLLNLLTDVEDLALSELMCIDWCPPPAPTSGASTLTGNDAGNTLRGAYGNDTIIGGGGADRLVGSLGDDRLLARDGVADRVECGAGSDSAVVDQFDLVGDSCESVDRVQAVSGIEDKPPTIAWARPSGMVVDAADDHALAKVDFLVDGRRVCTATAAPFECSFPATVKDVGRHTVVAVATDSAGQTTSVVRTLTIPRLTTRSVTLRVRGGVASGKVVLPADAPCTGKVRIGGETTKLRKNCTYRVRVKAAKSYVATYLGTSAVAPKRSKRVRART